VFRGVFGSCVVRVCVVFWDLGGVWSSTRTPGTKVNFSETGKGLVSKVIERGKPERREGGLGKTTLSGLGKRQEGCNFKHDGHCRIE